MKWLLLKDLQILRRSPLQLALLIIYPVAVALLVGFAAMSGQYVVLTLNRAERSNEELEQHVARKTTELEHSYTLLRESERDTARAQERERLLRDMHDGLGAQLMTALRGVEVDIVLPARIGWLARADAPGPS